jgi:hypothetical protein
MLGLTDDQRTPTMKDHNAIVEVTWPLRSTAAMARARA